METQTISIERYLSEAEINEQAKELSLQIKKYSNLSFEKKEAAREYKAQMDVVNEEIQIISKTITLGYVFEDRTCVVVKDFENNLILHKDVATGEVLAEYPLRPEDRQMELTDEVIEEEE